MLHSPVNIVSQRRSGQGLRVLLIRVHATAGGVCVVPLLNWFVTVDVTWHCGRNVCSEIWKRLIFVRKSDYLTFQVDSTTTNSHRYRTCLMTHKCQPQQKQIGKNTTPRHLCHFLSCRISFFLQTWRKILDYYWDIIMLIYSRERKKDRHRKSLIKTAWWHLKCIAFVVVCSPLPCEEIWPHCSINSDKTTGREGASPLEWARNNTCNGSLCLW